MNTKEAINFLQNKYPHASVFEGVIQGGMHDVVVARIWDNVTDDFIELEKIIVE